MLLIVVRNSRQINYVMPNHESTQSWAASAATVAANRNRCVPERVREGGREVGRHIVPFGVQPFDHIVTFGLAQRYLKTFSLQRGSWKASVHGFSGCSSAGYANVTKQWRERKENLLTDLAPLKTRNAHSYHTPRPAIHTHTHSWRILLHTHKKLRSEASEEFVIKTFSYSFRTWTLLFVRNHILGGVGQELSMFLISSSSTCPYNKAINLNGLALALAEWQDILGCFKCGLRTKAFQHLLAKRETSIGINSESPRLHIHS